jgi:hypothetical protein
VAVHQACLIVPKRSFNWLRGRTMTSGSFSTDAKVNIYLYAGLATLLWMLGVGERDRRNVQTEE